MKQSKKNYCSVNENDDVEEPDLSELTNKTNAPQEAILIIRCYENSIKTQNKKAMGYIGKQGQLLKNFKDI